VVGAVLGPPLKSSSSIALSSIESELFELVDILPRRMPSAEAPLAEAPDRPRVVTESRRRCWSVRPVLDWPEKGGPLEPVGGPRWKRFDRAACVMEPRRWRGASPPFWDPSADIVVG
jgi:hypothetical protein